MGSKLIRQFFFLNSLISNFMKISNNFRAFNSVYRDVLTGGGTHFSILDLKMGPTDCTETSVRNYHHSLRYSR